MKKFKLHCSQFYKLLNLMALAFARIISKWGKPRTVKKRKKYRKGSKAVKEKLKISRKLKNNKKIQKFTFTSKQINSIIFSSIEPGDSHKIYCFNMTRKIHNMSICWKLALVFILLIWDQNHHITAGSEKFEIVENSGDKLNIFRTCRLRFSLYSWSHVSRSSPYKGDQFQQGSIFYAVEKLRRLPFSFSLLLKKGHGSPFPLISIAR